MSFHSNIRDEIEISVWTKVVDHQPTDIMTSETMAKIICVEIWLMVTRRISSAV